VLTPHLATSQEARYELRCGPTLNIMLLLFKILLVPTIIALISLAGRYWGASISGLLGGLPIIAGPILVFLAIDHGDTFAESSAQAALCGVISIGIFCLAYAVASQRFGILSSTIFGLIGFSLGTGFFLVFQFSLVPTFGLVILVLITFLRVFPSYSLNESAYQTSIQDILIRMFAAACLVLLITGASQALGPRLSGLLAPFPVAGTILAGFTHSNCGADATRRLLDGFLKGLFGMAVFDFIFAHQLSSLGITLTVLLAAVLAVGASSITKRWTGRRALSYRAVNRQ
jgi:hypothetical protein